MVKLGVNIDHVATIRQIRKGTDPEPVLAAIIAEEAGADSIVIHLREDRRHINEKDLAMLRHSVKTKLNLEMSVAEEIVDIACKIKPDQATLVPEKRQELTTEGGLDILNNFKAIKKTAERLEKSGIDVSFFIDPEKKQIDAAKKTGVKILEFHTGRYAEAKNKIFQDKYFKELDSSVKYAKKLGFRVCAGHGLNYHNTRRISRIEEIEELNIGYAIVCRAVIAGLSQAVKEMKKLVSG